MNYKKHYDLLMQRGQTIRQLTYSEDHHIIPRCMFGSNHISNITKLTPQEHYVAHQLLVKIYPENLKLVHAANMMASIRPSNKLYGWLRTRLSESMKQDNPNADGKSRLAYIVKHGRSPIRKSYKLSDEALEQFKKRMKEFNPNADGQCKNKSIRLTSIDDKLIGSFNSFKLAKQYMDTTYPNLVWNQTSIIKSMKLCIPYKGIYWEYL